MKLLYVQKFVSDKPVYLQIAESIRKAIINGQLKNGENIPSSRELADTFSVNRHTVMAAMAELIAEGWVIANLRKGYQVNFDLPTQYIQSKKNVVNKKSYTAFNWQKINDTSDVNHSDFDMLMTKNHFISGAELRHFPVNEFRACIHDSLKYSTKNILATVNRQGFPSFIEAVTEYLRRMRAISDRDIMITHGSQEAIFITAELLLKPGDNAAVENLSYPPMVKAIQSRSANVIPIHMDEKGIDPNHFEMIAKKKKIKLIYLTPSHQYPTTITLDICRRAAIYDIAARYQIPILEDGYDHEFHYNSQPLPPLASHDPAQIVIHVSTFSKILFPSARLGYMVLPKGSLAKFLYTRSLTTRQNECLMQDAMARWINSGGFERHLRRMRRIYEERLNVMEKQLSRLQADGLPFSWETPAGGMSIWLDIQKNSADFAVNAKKHGLIVMAENDCQIKKSIGTHIRLGFSNKTPAEIQTGLNLIKKIWYST